MPRALRPHDHGQRHVEGLRDERLANRLCRRAQCRDQGDDEHPEPEHDERLHDLAGGGARGAHRRPDSACATCARSFGAGTISFFAGREASCPGFDCVPASGTFYLFPNVEAAMRIKARRDRHRASASRCSRRPASRSCPAPLSARRDTCVFRSPASRHARRCACAAARRSWRRESRTSFRATRACMF